MNNAINKEKTTITTLLELDNQVVNSEDITYHIKNLQEFKEVNDRISFGIMNDEDFSFNAYITVERILHTKTMKHHSSIYIKSREGHIYKYSGQLKPLVNYLKAMNDEVIVNHHNIIVEWWNS